MGFYVAMLFLTRVPLPQIKIDEQKMSSSTAFFPLVGVVLGGLCLLAAYLGKQILPINILACFIVMLSILLTGGMHLDGLADTLDGLFCGKERDKKLDIMRDSRVGSFGVIGIVFDILLKYVTIAHLLQQNAPMGIFLAPIMGRWMMTFAIIFFPYAREKGMGKAFSSKKNYGQFIISSIITVITSYLTMMNIGLITVFVVFIVGYCFTRYIMSQLGGMTGDTYGFINEVSEITSLITIAIYHNL